MKYFAYWKDSETHFILLFCCYSCTQ